MIEKDVEAHAAENEEQRRKRVRVEKELETTKEALKIKDSRIQKLDSLLSIGDWAGDILKWFGSVEKAHPTEEKTKYVVPK